LVSGTALEVNALQAYVARTVMRKSGQATASVSSTKFDMQAYQELLVDVFDEETQDDINSEKSSDDDNKDNNDDNEDEEERKEKTGKEQEEQTAERGNPNTAEEPNTNTHPSNSPPTLPMHTDTDPSDNKQAVHKQMDATNKDHMQEDTDVNNHQKQATIMDQDAQPEQENLDNDDSISIVEPDLSHPRTPAPTIPTQVTINITDSGLDTACTLDHESPGFAHKGTFQRASQPTQECTDWTCHIYNLSRVTDHWRTTCK